MKTKRYPKINRYVHKWPVGTVARGLPDFVYQKIVLLIALGLLDKHSTDILYAAPCLPGRSTVQRTRHHCSGGCEPTGI